MPDNVDSIADASTKGQPQRITLNPHGDKAMKFMILVKATADSEAGALPDEKLLTAMGNYNEELVKAGVMRAGDGLHPSSNGARGFRATPAP
jgi:hypothetical protein